MTPVTNQFQHYVSQFYLRGWQVEVNSKPKRVWIYEKGGHPRHRAIKNVAGEENFYAIEEFDGTIDNSTIEQYLGIAESKVGTMFQKFTRKEIINETEREIFAEFLTVFLMRSPASKKKIAELSKEFLPRIIKPLRKRAQNFPEVKKEKVLENINKVENWHKEKPASLFPRLVAVRPQVARYIDRMDWIFLCSKNSEFLTCDNPLIYNRGTGITDPKYGHIIFPVNRTISFQATNANQFNNGYVEIEDKLVEEINSRVVGNAHKQVYATYYSEELDNYIQNHLGEDLNNG